MLGHPLGQSASFFEIYLFPPILGSPWHVAVLRAPWDAHGHGRHALDPLLRAMRDGIIATATVRDDIYIGLCWTHST